MVGGTLGKALVGCVAAVAVAAGGAAAAGSPRLVRVSAGPPPLASGAARHPGTGLVAFIGAPAGEALAGPAAVPGAPAAAAARAWVGANAGLFGLDAPGAALETIREEARPGGGAIVRLRQTHRGVPVFGAQLNVALDAARRVRWVAAETVSPGDLDTTPVLDAAAARAAARAATAAKYGLPENSLAAGEATLAVYDPVVFTPARRAPGLVWRLEVTAAARPVRELVLVDARDGAVRLAFNRIDAALARETYTMGNETIDERPLPGDLLCDDGANPGGCAGDADALAAHAYAGDTYAYLAAVLGRDSIDGAGMTLVSSVHYGVDFQNAFWEGSQMVYGDGYAQADDVVGHELAHGLTDYTSGLFYWAESGAISESYSDLHGEFTDLLNAAGTDGDAVRWLLGEDLPGGAIRSMSDPPAGFDPDRMSSPHFYRSLFDNAGVHTNSGVNNKAVYLLTDGDSFNGQTVAPLGLEKVAWLYYVVQRDYLTPASNYVDLAAFLRAACGELAATADHGFAAADCDEVDRALLAVEMDQLPGQRFVNADDPRIQTRGTWRLRRSEWALYGSYRQSRRPGNVARIPFQGSRATIYYVPVPGGGILDVYLDSRRTWLGSIDQRRTDPPGAWALELRGLPAGEEHTLILRHRSGKRVNFDAVAYRGDPEDLPADPLDWLLADWAWRPADVQHIAYRGHWNVWPTYLSMSYRRRDTAIFTFTGDAMRIYFWGGSFLGWPRLGVMRISVDGETLIRIDQSLVPEGSGLYYIEWLDLPHGRHRVRVAHAAGELITLDAVEGADSRL